MYYPQNTVTLVTIKSHIDLTTVTTDNCKVTNKNQTRGTIMIPKKPVPINPKWRLRNNFTHQPADPNLDPAMKAFLDELKTPESCNNFLQQIRKFDLELDSFIGLKTE